MFIIDCLPFSKGLNKESLSYFSAESFEPGSLIKVNIKNKSLHALVLQCRDATEAKTEIKSANFQLKKISGFAGKPFLQKEFLEAVQTTAEYFAATGGGILAHLIPALVLEHLPPPSKTTFKLPQKIAIGSSILQDPDEERFTLYRSLVREEFASQKSVFLCLPQNEDVRYAKSKLERGIESFVCAFHDEMSKKELKEELKKAYQTPHPVLVIGTARWLFLGRDDFGTIIIDKENENGWKTLARPFIDLRFFAESLAQKKNIRAIIGDAFLRTETLYRYEQGEILEFENVKWRLPSKVETKVVDLKVAIKKEKEFKTLSPELIELIRETAGKSARMFIFAVRKGLSSVTICGDCGEQVRCGNCAAPMVLYRTNPSSGSGGVFKCHQCGEMRDAAEMCQNCGSWKLSTYGAGIDRIAEEIKKEFPDIKVFEIHKDMTSTDAKALRVAKDFYESRGAVLLGTEMAFSYLYKKVASAAIASFDSLFSIPDFRIREKIFRLILQTKDIARENFLIQTRNPNNLAVEAAVIGNLTELYKKEIEDRKALAYPPFGIFIKVTVRGIRPFVERETKNLKNILKDYNPAIFSSIHEKRGEQAAVNAVIKLPKENWPDPDIIAVLKSLPSHFEIKVDPDNLL